MEVAVKIESEQISWVVAGASSLGRDRSLEAEAGEIESGDEFIEEPHGIVRGDIIIEHIWQQCRLSAIDAGDVGHGQLSRKWIASNELAYNIGNEFSHRLRMKLVNERMQLMRRVVGQRLGNE